MPIATTSTEHADPTRSSANASSVARTPAWKPLLALVVLTTLLKLALILCPSKHLSPKWVMREEQHRGNIAVELLDGPLLSLQDYHHAPNVGGSLVVGVLAVPFVLVLGPTIVAVRLVPIAFNALAVALLFLILDRFVGRRAAWIGGLLMAMAPPGYSLIAVTAWGSHLENNALTLACVYVYLQLASDVGRRNAGKALLFGVLAGFATYFGYFFAVALAALLAFEFVQDKAFVLRRWFWIFALGFAIGFTPWVTYNLTHDFRGLSIYGQSWLDHVDPSQMVSSPWQRVVALFTRYLPASYFFERFPLLGRGVPQWIVHVLFLMLVGAALWSMWPALARAARALFTRARGRVALAQERTDSDLAAGVLDPALAFVVYIVFFTIAFAMFDVEQEGIEVILAHDGRYVAPLYPFLVMLAAVALDHCACSGSFRARASTTITVALCSIALVGTLAVCDFSRFGSNVRAPGTSQEELARFIMTYYRTDTARLDRIVARLESSRPKEVEHGMIFALGQGLKWGMLRDDPKDRDLERTRARNAQALRFLHERVAQEFKPYCELPVEGERFYNYRERDVFWEDYEARKLEQAADAAAK